MSRIYIPGFLQTGRRLLVGMYRHDDTCRPGLWRVVICGVSDWTMDIVHDAVVDDFGNLVKVSS